MNVESPELPNPGEKCLHCSAPLPPNRPTSFCSGDCERIYVKRTILKPTKRSGVVRKAKARRR